MKKKAQKRSETQPYRARLMQDPVERIADALEAIAEHLEGIRAILGEQQ
jgi:hypothetical protein